MADNHPLVWNAPLVLLALVLVLPLSAREIPVGTSQGSPSLAEALQEASDGDTIVLAAGTYSGAGNRGLSIEGKRVRIEGRGEVVIDLEDSGEFLLAQESLVELSGLRFQNASGDVIHVEDGSLVGENCSFAGGVRLSDSNAVLQRCEIRTSDEGTAILAIGSGDDGESPSLTLESCLLRGTTAVETAGVAEVRLFNCTVLALSEGTAVRSDGAVFLNNTITQGSLSRLPLRSYRLPPRREKASSSAKARPPEVIPPPPPIFG